MEPNTGVAFVTGASKGLGRQIALSLGAAGCAVAVGYLKDSEGAQEVADALRISGVQAEPVGLDVSESASIQNALNIIESRLGRVEIVVNNAVETQRQSFEQITPEAWDRVLAVGLKGVFLCSQIIGTRIPLPRGGAIVNIASTAGIQPEPRSHHYVAAKAGVIGLTRALALTFAPHVTVNAVAPGYIQSTDPATAHRESRAAAAARIPLGRFAEENEVAELVVYLTLRGRYITGQTIVIDGGLTLV